MSDDLPIRTPNIFTLANGGIGVRQKKQATAVFRVPLDLHTAFKATVEKLARESGINITMTDIFTRFMADFIEAPPDPRERDILRPTSKENLARWAVPLPADGLAVGESRGRQVTTFTTNAFTAGPVVRLTKHSPDFGQWPAGTAWVDEGGNAYDKDGDVRKDDSWMYAAGAAAWELTINAALERGWLPTVWMPHYDVMMRELGAIPSAHELLVQFAALRSKLT